jgi:hypothetical protein
MATSIRQRLGIGVIAVAIGTSFSTPTLADPKGHGKMSSLPPLPAVNTTDDIAISILDNARLRLKAGDREGAATLTHVAFELIVASERNGHKHTLSTDELETSTRR